MAYEHETGTGTRRGRAQQSAQAARTEVRCSLCIFSNTLQPDQVTELVGSPPTTSREIGDPIRSRGVAGPVVQRHQWIWEVPADIEPAMTPQLDTLRAALGSRAEAVLGLRDAADVYIDVVISHFGPTLSLGWTMTREQIDLIAAFDAGLSVDEYDYTES